MSDPNTSPVSLPAGSYDYDALKSGVDKAAKGAARNYDEAIKSAVSDSMDSVHVDQDPRAIPGFKFVEADNDLGGKETIQVPDPDAIDATDEAESGAIPENSTRPARATAKSAEAADTTKE